MVSLEDRMLNTVYRRLKVLGEGRDFENAKRLMEQLYMLKKSYPERFNPTPDQWRKLTNNTLRLLTVLDYYSSDFYEKSQKANKIFGMLITEIVHAGNPSFQSVQDRVELLIKTLDAYIKISKITDKDGIRFDPSRAYRFLEWFSNFGNKVEIKQDSVMIKILKNRKFSEAEVMISYMYLGENVNEMLYARTLSNYKALIRDIKYEELFKQLNLDPLGMIITRLIGHEPDVKKSIKNLDDWAWDNMVSLKLNEIVRKFDISIEDLEKLLNRIDNLRNKYIY